MGPPGCSKTLLARAVAAEAGLNFMAVKGPELLSKWVGASEQAVAQLFARCAAKLSALLFGLGAGCIGRHHSLLQRADCFGETCVQQARASD